MYRAHLLDYLNRARVDRRITIVGRTGWHDIGGTSVFILPTETIGTYGRETVVLDSSGASPYDSRGTLQEWKDNVGSLTKGHRLPILAISTALAGPLLHIAGMDGGGVNLFGRSSRGKSTCGECAASVWGKGSSPGYVRSWRATANALEATAAISSDTVLILDELGVVEAREAASGVYQLASGTGKGRSARDGSLRSSLTWRVMVLSTGEMPMAAKINEDRNGRRAQAGQAVRLLDIPGRSREEVGLPASPKHLPRSRCRLAKRGPKNPPREGSHWNEPRLSEGQGSQKRTRAPKGQNHRLPADLPGNPPESIVMRSPGMEPRHVEPTMLISEAASPPHA